MPCGYTPDCQFPIRFAIKQSSRRSQLFVGSIPEIQIEFSMVEILCQCGVHKLCPLPTRSIKGKNLKHNFRVGATNKSLVLHFGSSRWFSSLVQETAEPFKWHILAKHMLYRNLVFTWSRCYPIHNAKSEIIDFGWPHMHQPVLITLQPRLFSQASITWTPAKFCSDLLKFWLKTFGPKFGKKNFTQTNWFGISLQVGRRK